MNGPAVLDRALGPAGTSITYTGITASGCEVTSTYSWGSPELAAEHLAASEADFQHRLTTVTAADAGQATVRHCGPLTVIFITGIKFRLIPRARLKAMRGGGRGALLASWLGVAVAAHWGRR